MAITVSGTTDMTVIGADISGLDVPSGYLPAKPCGGWGANRGQHELAVECGTTTLYFVGPLDKIEALQRAMEWLLECDEEPEEDDDEPEDDEPQHHADMQEMADDDRAHAMRERRDELTA